MDKAKITAIYDDGAKEATSYIGAKGFSILIEVDGQRTLFGVGRKDRYLSNNLYVAGVETDSIDRAVISHGHPDHWAGLAALFRDREAKVPLYSTSSAWGVKKFLGTTGMCFGEAAMERIERNNVSDWVQLSEHLFITAPIRFHDGTGDELFVVLVTKNGPVVLSGCCHCGLDHVFDAVKEKFGSYPIGVIGGLHIGDRNSNLAAIYADYLEKMGCRHLYLNHCTGTSGISKLRFVLGLKGVNDFYAGESVEFAVF